MNQFFLGNALWQLIIQSDLISKSVLVILAVLSLLCWSIFLYKWMIIRNKKRAMKKALTRITTVNTLEELKGMCSGAQGSLPGYFLGCNLSLVSSQLEVNRLQSVPVISLGQWDMIQDSIVQAVDNQIRNEESYLSIISTAAAVSPLLGLFGTVWGLVHAFIRISQENSADIATVAPGIAEALITTLAGLMVAIPAVMMANYLQQQIHQLEGLFCRFIDKTNVIIQRQLVR